jgi:hypothetical protein
MHQNPGDIPALLGTSHFLDDKSATAREIRRLYSLLAVV